MSPKYQVPNSKSQKVLHEAAWNWGFGIWYLEFGTWKALILTKELAADEIQRRGGREADVNGAVLREL